MSRQARLVIPGTPHHVTQRGHRRGDLFFSDSDRLRFIDWLAEAALKWKLSIIAYCLMTNHIHLEVVPEYLNSLHLVFKSVFTKYAMRFNLLSGWNGYVVQGRFYSSPLDDKHAWLAVRYIEQNPVRAHMVARPEEYRWSSAYTRARNLPDPLVDTSNPWYQRLVLGTECERAEFQLLDEQSICRFRTLNARNLPIADDDYLLLLEQKVGRSLRLRNPGRPFGTKRQK